MDKIGFMGLGAMGVPMAGNLLKAGHTLMVFNRTKGKSGPLEAAGARVAASPRELVGWADVIMMMLSGPVAIDETLAALLVAEPGALAGKLVVNMGTNPPAYSRELEARLKAADAVFVDAPVLGTKGPAELGQLIILASGPDGAIARLEPAFGAIGKAVVPCGEIPQAGMMKLAFNLVMSTALEGLLEGAHFAQKAGLDLEAFFKLVQQGPVGNAIFGLKIEKILARDFTAQASLSTVREMFKHLVDTAHDIGAWLPGTMTNMDLTNRAVEMGLGQDDVCVLIKTFEKGGGRVPA